MPPSSRVLLGGAGLFAIVMPVYDFRRVLLPPSFLSLFFLAIVAGAWVVGGGFLFAAVFGTHQKWRFRDGLLTIDQTSLLRKWQIVISRESIESSGVRENDSDSGPNTYSVVLSLRGGRNVFSHGFATAAAAEAFRQEILAFLERA